MEPDAGRLRFCPSGAPQPGNAAILKKLASVVGSVEMQAGIVYRESRQDSQDATLLGSGS